MSITGVIFDVKRFAVHDGPGIRTTIFFKGCPLRCQWCHNPESQRLEPEVFQMNGHRVCARWLWSATPGTVGKEVTVEDCLREIEKDVLFFDESGGGVTFSGGEPLMQPEFLQALLESCHGRGVHTTVDTSGHAPWSSIESLYREVDLFLYDLKLMDPVEHETYINVTNQQILSNLKKLHHVGATISLRIPLIPGITDTDENLGSLIEFISPLSRIHEINLLPYNPIGEDKYKRFNQVNELGHLSVQTPEELDRIRNRFASLDAHITIGG